MQKPNNGPPVEEMDMLALLRDIHSRVIRIETRQARHMQAQGFDKEGKQTRPTVILRQRRAV